MNGIKNVAKIASLSKINRLLINPVKYIYSVFYVRSLYNSTKEEKIATATLFFGRKMKIALPAATDIYLTGGKSHISEIRLAEFIITHLQENAHFLDIGAHYGYFTLLASEIVGPNGKVAAFEPSAGSFRLLEENTQGLPQTAVFPMAVSGAEEELTFYEFPNLYSEYNSTDVTQFEHQEWYRHIRPARVTVKATTIDRITEDGSFRPGMIKIDVEGAEADVIGGGMRYLSNHAPVIAMEYLAPDRKNHAHKKAVQALRDIGYRANIIVRNGGLKEIEDIDGYLVQERLESDNIIFTGSR